MSPLLKLLHHRSRPFNDYGLDSLGNLELRTRIETNLGIRIAPKAVAENNSA